MSSEYTFEVASDGKKGLERLNDDTKKIPDGVLLDLNMPVMDGMQCLREIKDSSNKDIPVIFYSTGTADD